MIGASNAQLGSALEPLLGSAHKQLLGSAHELALTHTLLDRFRRSNASDAQPPTEMRGATSRGKTPGTRSGAKQTAYARTSATKR